MTDPLFDLEAFLNGDCASPSSVLGLRTLPDGGLFARTFAPRARRVELLRADTGEAVAELRMAHPEGIFEGVVPRLQRWFPYRFRVHGWGEAPVEAEDPYRFASGIGEMDAHLMGEGTHYRLYEKLGAHPAVRDGVAGVDFAVWAPNARRVSVVGPFNTWDGRRHLLRPWGSTGVWELFVPGLLPGDLYKFEIKAKDGRLLPLKADPFAFRCEHAPGTASVVEDPAPYAWGDGDWMADRWKRNRFDAPMSIYEVHLGSWRRREDGGFMGYRELADELVPYVRELGFTHVQFLPVSEHPFYASWGYQPLGMFAPTSRYGSPADFKVLVDRCHQAGLGVILDWVPAHFPADAHGLAEFDGTHLYEHADPRKGRHMDWGTLIYNYGRTEVQNYLIANALFWLDRYHVDGLRVDAVASMLYLDYSRPQGQWVPNRYGGRENLEAVDFLRRLNEVVYAQFPDVCTIAEESTAWPMVSRPTSSGGLGFGFKWNMGWMHDTLGYLGRNMLHRQYHHGEITFSMLYNDTENFVLPLSHDEVVHGKKSLLWRMPGSRWEQFANLRLLFAYQFLHPGKKLLFMGGEFGQDHEWDHNRSLDWDLLAHEPHQGVQRLVKDLNALYRSDPVLFERDCAPGGFEWIDCEDKRNSVLALMRKGDGPFLAAALNFTAQPLHGYRIGVPRPGRYEEILNTDAAWYGGQNFGNGGAVETEPIPAHGHPQSLSLTLPPLGAVVFRAVH
ncbi:1,4-alpha-glucan branching protein GlgB [Mesoterricola sediminis]|uniref:1,4-alpha-glucan branching enzyme GlgB n=1 Tax=Mesoterricola sediminis TaxID=2927980 RepID=A0AA48KDR7_9BACT|nr:1,4-alpha-glucan branching protein GlgB [Mesoterricola sediminis]BDU76612.1 1,4-alpha-glucan branching enzyme GlgB [Mesoterricola sediminis]